MGKVVYQRKRKGKAVRTGCGEIGCIKTHNDCGQEFII